MKTSTSKPKMPPLKTVSGPVGTCAWGPHPGGDLPADSGTPALGTVEGDAESSVGGGGVSGEGGGPHLPTEHRGQRGGATPHPLHCRDHGHRRHARQRSPFGASEFLALNRTEDVTPTAIADSATAQDSFLKRWSASPRLSLGKGNPCCSAEPTPHSPAPANSEAAVAGAWHRPTAMDFI